MVDVASRSGRSVGGAGAGGCELDAQRRCRRDREELESVAPVDVRISPGRRRRERARAPALVVERSAGEALDDALRAFADVVADCD